MNNSRLILFFLSSVLMTMVHSCRTEPYTLDVEEVRSDEVSVISVLENGIEFGVLVSRVLPLNELDVSYAVENAEVVLYEDMVPIDTLDYVEPRSGDPDPLSSGQYLSADAMNLRSGSYYHLTVDAPGLRAVKSEPVLFTKVFSDRYAVERNSDTIGNVVEEQPIITFEILTSDDCEIVDGTFQRTLTTTDDVHFLIISTRYRSPFFNQESREIIGSNLPVGSYSFDYGPLFFRIDPNIQPQLTCYSIICNTPHFMEFSEALANQGREGIGGLDADPVILPSNIIGGHGYFSVRDRQLRCFRYN